MKNFPFARALLTVSALDPFGLYRLPEAQAAAASPRAIVNDIIPPLTPPAPPIFNYQIFGRMTGLDSKHAIYLNQDDRLIQIEQGTILDSGFQVQQITDGEVLIRHQPTGEEVRIVIPGSTP